MKVLIVDDSVVFRMSISQALEGVPGIHIAGKASNGQVAIEMLKNDPEIELITLDMEMPVMDGMQTIQEIRKFNKTLKIIVFSSLTQKGAEKTIEALSHGANDFVTKQETSGALAVEESLEMIRDTLVPKIEAFTKKYIVPDNVETVSLTGDVIEEMPVKPKLIVIASSTGGPDALGKIFSSIECKVNVPILLVQHMPPVFTGKLAEMLNKYNDFVNVKEAQAGDVMEVGKCLIAPGDFHMTLNGNGVVSLNQDEKNCYVRPSANVLFDSVADVYKDQVLTIILTGMGEDGAVGAGTLKKQGSYLYVQDEASSVVWGMPGATVNKVPGTKILSLENICHMLNKTFSRI